MPTTAAKNLRAGDLLVRKLETTSGEILSEPCEVLRATHYDDHVFVILRRLGYPEGTRNLQTSGSYRRNQQVTLEVAP